MELSYSLQLPVLVFLIKEKSELLTSKKCHFEGSFLLFTAELKSNQSCVIVFSTLQVRAYSLFICLFLLFRKYIFRISKLQT